MVENSKIKTVFLDWFGTQSLNTFWEHWQDPTHPNNRYVQSIEDFFRHGEMVDPWMRGLLTAEDFVKEMGGAIGVNDDILLKGLRESCRAMQFISPEIPALISRLREQGKTVIVATDNMDTFSRWTVPSMNLDEIVNGVLNSHTLGALKSDFDQEGNSLFFGDYFNCHGIKAGEAILFDDSGHTREIATRCRMLGVQLPFGRRLVENLQHLVA